MHEFHLKVFYNHVHCALVYNHVKQNLQAANANYFMYICLAFTLNEKSWDTIIFQMQLHAI